MVSLDQTRKYLLGPPSAIEAADLLHTRAIEAADLLHTNTNRKKSLVASGGS